MATVRDLYEILGVGRDASAGTSAAYRKLARELHPDVNADPADQERFKEVTGAYEILSDPAKASVRRVRVGRTAGGPVRRHPGPVRRVLRGRLRRSLAGPRSRARRGEDLRVAVRLSFPGAVFGEQREIEVEHLATCGRCGGNGAEPGTSPIPCRTCGGAGEVQAVRRSIFGTVMTSTPCVACGGTGEEILDRCETCFGEGRVRSTATVASTSPPGSWTGWICASRAAATRASRGDRPAT